MNKTLLIASLLLGLTTLMQAQPVSRETARRAATTFLDANGAKTAQLTDVSAEIGFANLYVFTTDQSFVILSADSRVQPVLGYSLNGPFVAEDMPNNVLEWLQSYDDEIQWAIDNNLRAAQITTHQWQDFENGVKGPRATVVVSPLIQTRWNQNKYYNNLCPLVGDGPDGHAFTGCVATAMAQIMKYWEYPSHGIGSHAYVWGDQTLSADFGATSYDWDHMNAYYEYYYDDNGVAHWLSAPSSEELVAVATLMYHCGVSVDMNYGGQSTSGSGAVTAYVADALKTYFNYSPDIEYKAKADYEDNWITMVKAELDAGRPMQYSGRSRGGHSFICDGYNSDDKFHFNWGWSGRYDGYFSLDNLNTGANNQSGQGNGVYTSNQSAIFGIQPAPCVAAEPLNLNYSLSGIQNLTLNWAAASGAVSYNIYRNNNCVGNVATVSYTEAAPFGSNVYYVRSVDANGYLSLCSNTVVVNVGYQTPMVNNLAAAINGNNVDLTWAASGWCYPETPTATLNYGEGSVYSLWTYVYFAHRHLAAELTQYAGKAVYKVSTFIQYPGTYSVYIYTNSTQYDQPDPNSLAFSKTDIQVTTTHGWYEIDLNEPIILTGTNDLWVVMKQENTGQPYPTPCFNLSEHNTNAFYAGNSSPTSLYDASSSYNCAWFINTYLTDGTYTYNLYRDDEPIANAIADTHYTDSGLADGTYTYHLTTNYYSGETEPSNSVTVTVPGLVTQTVELAATWTWWTPIVATTLDELEAAIGSNGILINSQDGGFVRCENDQWSGTLQDFVPGQMYRIATQEADTFTLTGMPVTTAGISILQGYNWFGYMGMQPADIATALGGFTPALNDQIIGQEGTATYNGSEWTGGLTTLVPGKGYVYHSTASERKTLLIGQ